MFLGLKVHRRLHTPSRWLSGFGVLIEYQKNAEHVKRSAFKECN